MKAMGIQLTTIKLMMHHSFYNKIKNMVLRERLALLILNSFCNKIKGKTATIIIKQVSYFKIVKNNKGYRKRRVGMN